MFAYSQGKTEKQVAATRKFGDKEKGVCSKDGQQPKVEKWSAATGSLCEFRSGHCWLVLYLKAGTLDGNWGVSLISAVI